MTTETKTHHIFGTSTAKYWSKCPGWAGLIKTLPPTPPGKDADKGTAVHYGVLEIKTAREIEVRQTGKSLPIVYENIPNWPADGEEIANGFWEAIWKNVLEEFITGKIIYIEKKVMFDEASDAGGTLDLIVIYYNDKGELVAASVDLKTGRVRVEPDCDQIKYSLAAVMRRLDEKGKRIEKFKGAIYQPQHFEPYTECWFTRKEIETAAKKYEKAIAASFSPKAKLKAGDHCSYCRGIGACTAYNDMMNKKMDLAVAKGKNELIAPEHLPDETLLNIFLYSDQVEDYLSRVRKFIVSRFANGNPVKGLKLISGVAKRRWKDEFVVEQVLRPHINPFTEKLMGITAVESMLKNTGKTKQEIAELMVQVTEKPEGHPKVVSEEDPRQAISISRPDLLIGLDGEDEND